MTALLVLNLFFLLLTDAFLLLLCISSLVEREKRAARLSFLLLLGNSAFWAALLLFKDLRFMVILDIAAVTALTLLALISFMKFFPKRLDRHLSEAEQFDERNHMFARNNLKFYPDLAAQYYATQPAKKDIDRKIHEKPEIGEPGAAYYDEYLSPLFDSAFTYLKRTRLAASGELGKVKKRVDKEKITAAVKSIARFYGAVDVGITRLLPLHLYSHAGRHSGNWGQPIQNNHRFAVVIVVAMDIPMIKKAPTLPVILESSRRYVESAGIAHIIAGYLRSFGWDARSHTDGNYQVLCVPLAVAAGLGELGRLGIFMHPVCGPSVRISVVTTELELVPSQKKEKIYRVEEFCRLCKKCAENCPSQSIPPGEEPESRGFRHWSINQERCFAFWKSIGTDCALCISVCPYTKPDTLVHRLVRFYISRNPFNQRIALLFDDLLYGRKKQLSHQNPGTIF